MPTQEDIESQELQESSSFPSVQQHQQQQQQKNKHKEKEEQQQQATPLDELDIHSKVQ